MTNLVQFRNRDACIAIWLSIYDENSTTVIKYVIWIFLYCSAFYECDYLFILG